MKKVILVTDGDEIAKAAVERAAQNLNLRTISSSAGNPYPFARGEDSGSGFGFSWGGGGCDVRR